MKLLDLKSKGLHFIIIMLLYPMLCLADEASISNVNSALTEQVSEITELIGTILTILVIVAFLFMVSQIVYSKSRMKEAIVSFGVLLLLKGMFFMLFQ